MSQEAGRLLIIVGVVLIVLGLLVTFGKGVPFLGKLPGDIRIERDNFRFYFPLASSILVSVILTLILRLFRR